VGCGRGGGWAKIYFKQKMDWDGSLMAYNECHRSFIIRHHMTHAELTMLAVHGAMKAPGCLPDMPKGRLIGMLP